MIILAFIPVNNWRVAILADATGSLRKLFFMNFGAKNVLYLLSI